MLILIKGLADARVPPADSAGYATNIANASQYLAPTAGHNYDQAGGWDELYAVFSTWLKAGASENTARKRAAFSRL